MPESECRQCGERFVAPTDNELKQLELDHHVASEEPVKFISVFGERDTTKHMCIVFVQFDEGGVHGTGIRAYAHGKYRTDI